jgi:vitamin B12 transporter
MESEYKKDEKKKEPLLQRPRNKVKASINYHILDRAHVGLDFIYVDERYDYHWLGNVKLNDYELFNVAVSYDVTKNLTFFCRVHNIFDEDYEDVFGYGIPGTSGYAGFKLSF